MNIKSIACNECGAPLEVSEKSNFVSCNYCGSTLKIQRSESSTYTEVIAKIDDVSKDIQIVKLQNDVSLLDKDWVRERAQFCLKDHNGNAFIISSSYVLKQVFLHLILIAVLSAISYAVHLYWFIIFVIISIFVLVITAKRNYRKVGLYKDSLLAYQEKRNHLMEQINNSNSE